MSNIADWLFRQAELRPDKDALLVESSTYTFREVLYPADIEEVLYRHPAVAGAAVVGSPDEVLGEVPRALVALKPSADAAPQELLDACKAELASFKVPVSIEILPERPKGPTGKFLRRMLQRGSPTGPVRLVGP